MIRERYSHLANLAFAARAGSCSGFQIVESGIPEFDPPPDVVLVLMFGLLTGDLESLILELPASSPHLNAGKPQFPGKVPSPEHLARVSGLEDQAFHISPHSETSSDCARTIRARVAYTYLM